MQWRDRASEALEVCLEAQAAATQDTHPPQGGGGGGQRQGGREARVVRWLHMARVVLQATQVGTNPSHKRHTLMPAHFMNPTAFCLTK